MGMLWSLTSCVLCIEKIIEMIKEEEQQKR